jgi:hypothetical protein
MPRKTVRHSLFAVKGRWFRIVLRGCLTILPAAFLRLGADYGEEEIRHIQAAYAPMPELLERSLLSGCRLRNLAPG